MNLIDVATFAMIARDVVLDLKTDLDGVPIHVQYRPALAINPPALFREHPDPPALATIEFISSLVVLLSVDGHFRAVDRADLTCSTMGLLVGLLPKIGEHCDGWIQAQREHSGGYWTTYLAVKDVSASRDRS